MAKTAYTDLPLSHIFRWERTPKGEIGIEIEVEGGPWPEEAISNWIVHADGSLRDGGIEYVIRQPVARDRVRTSLQTLSSALAQSNKVFSWRTSVHVHVNVQDLTVRQWVNFLALFCIFEEMAVAVIGPERAGNKFCLRFKDADETLRSIRTGIRNENLREYVRGDYKYASANIKATSTHGTLEFRAMQGNLDENFIGDWSDLLCALKDAAKVGTSPVFFCEEMSALGAYEFARKYLPRNNFISDRILANPNLNDSMYEGVRLAQDLAYCTDWENPPEARDAAPPPAPRDAFEEAMAAVQAMPRPAIDGWLVNNVMPAVGQAPQARPLRVRVPRAQRAPIVNPFDIEDDDF